MDPNFVNWLKRQSLKPATVKKHLKLLRVLKKSCENFTVENLEQFLLAKKENSRAQTVNAYIGTIRVYGKYIGDINLQHTKFFKREPFTGESMTDVEINSFLRGCDDLQCVWCCFWWLVSSTGARPSEIANLSVGDINFGVGVMKFKNTKTNEDRVIPIPLPVRDMLKTQCLRVGVGHLFLTQKGRVFSDRSWLKNFKKRLVKAGIKDRGLSAYALRRSYITTMLSQDGVNVFQVQRLVGHRKLETTQGYYRLVMTDLQRIIKKHPLSRAECTFSSTVDLVLEAIEALRIQDYRGIKQTISRDGNRLVIELSEEKGSQPDFI